MFAGEGVKEVNKSTGNVKWALSNVRFGVILTCVRGPGSESWKRPDHLRCSGRGGALSTLTLWFKSLLQSVLKYLYVPQTKHLSPKLHRLYSCPPLQVYYSLRVWMDGLKTINNLLVCLHAWLTQSWLSRCICNCIMWAQHSDILIYSSPPRVLPRHFIFLRNRTCSECVGGNCNYI